MTLHYNLKELFLFCFALMLWHILFSGTLLFALGFTLVIMVYQGAKKCLSYADGAFVGAFLLNLWYVLGSWGNVRQYDYFNFFMHADYFVAHQFFLYHPVDYLQSVYFQPPLWGFICGLVTKLAMILGKTKEFGFDFVRFISLFAISGIGIIFWRLLGKFDFKLIYKIWGFVLFLFLPINGIMANLVNNDTMVYFLMTAIIYMAVCWYEDSSWRHTFIISGLFFMAAMVKFSGLMVAPFVGILGLFKLVEQKNKLSLRLWGQFLVIGLGAITGFAWGLMLLYHHLPLTPPPLNNDFQNMEGYGLIERMFFVGKMMLPFADLRAGGIEPNVWLTLVKTSLFGEWTWGSLFSGYVLYGIGIVLAVLCLWSFFYLTKYKLGENYALNVAIVALVFAVLIAWINFWIVYPFFCSSEYRYVVILQPVAVLWLINYLNHKKLPKFMCYTLAGLVVLMIIARFTLYLYTI